MHMPIMRVLIKAEAAVKYFESGGALAKRGTFVYDQIQRFYVVHEPNENF
jgi:hypothetical protein